MRKGCLGERDYVLIMLYGSPFEKALEEYSLRKRVLAVHLLREAPNEDLVRNLIELEVSGVKKVGGQDIVKSLCSKPLGR